MPAPQEQAIPAGGVDCAPALRRPRRPKARSPACRAMRSNSCTRQRDALSSRRRLDLPQVHRQNEKRRQLAGERLGGSHADLRTGVRIERARGLARDHGAHHVADGQRFRTLGFASRCAASVSAVSPDCEITTVSVCGAHDRIAIAEFAAVIHLHRDARQLLDHELAGQPGVPTGAAGDNLDLPEARELGRRDVHFVEENAARLLPHAAQAWYRGRRAAARKSP